MIEECIRTVEPMIKPENVELSSNVAIDLPEIYSDRDKLKQIVLNLLSNAVKFTERGQIRLVAKGDKEWVAIDVSDTGPGIPRDKFNFIFEEFRQVDGGATRQHGGTGLGLSISRHLAHLLGGDIFVDSIVGQGSTFTIRLPAIFQGNRGFGRRGADEDRRKRHGMRYHEKDPDRRGCRLQQGPAHAVAGGRIRADRGNRRPSRNCCGGAGAAGSHSDGSVASCD